MSVAERWSPPRYAGCKMKHVWTAVAFAICAAVIGFYILDGLGLVLRDRPATFGAITLIAFILVLGTRRRPR
jgi:hypothetical protein